MSRAMVSLEDVRELALALPSTVERPSYGTPGFRVADRLFARVREEGDVLVVWVEGLDEKEFMLAADPATFFTTPHYDGHPMVLVRMGVVERDELGELLEASWRIRAPKRVVAAFDAERG